MEGFEAGGREREGETVIGESKGALIIDVSSGVLGEGLNCIEGENFAF